MLRREAIKGIAGAGAIAGEALVGAGRLEASESSVASDMVRFGPEIEPLVRLIEETPRGRLLETLADRLNGGLSYRAFLASLFLAGIRNVSPQPPGFKFHCVFVLHSAHQLGLDAPYRERLLPLMWAADYFKQSQERDVEEGDFRLRPVKGPLPSAGQAWDEFRAAMDSWDEDRADRAIAALARTRGAHEVVEGLWRYGARDYRNIGHKAIFTANTWRTLQVIGWRHAEAALRSLTLGLLDFGTERRMNGYGFEDQCHAANAETARKALRGLPAGWISAGSPDPSATGEIVSAIREGRPVPASAAVARMLTDGSAGAGDAWQGIHLAAGELMMRLPGILGVHCVTSANALHYAFRVASDPETRLYLLLQGVGWMGQFTRFMAGEDRMRDVRIAAFEGADAAGGAEAAARQVLDLRREDADRAARKAHGYASAHADLTPFFRAARSLVFRKADDSHRFKFAAAAFEDLALASPSWRPHLLAAASYYLHGTGDPDSEVAARAMDALKVA